MIFTNTVSDVEGQIVLFNEVMVNTTLPFEISEELIWYDVVGELGLRIFPPPDVAQATDVADPALKPFNVILFVLEQIERFTPALTVGCFTMFKRILSVTAEHTPLLVEVKVKLTKPAVKSAGERE